MNETIKNDRAAWLQGPPRMFSRSTRTQEPLAVGSTGSAGVGKARSRTSDRASGGLHLSTGDVFRAAGSGATAINPAMKAAMEYMRRGDLVPDSTVWEMVRERSH